MARITIYRNYKLFGELDPIIEAMRIVVKSQEQLNNARAHAITGVATATFNNWFDGTTRRPQNATVTQAMGALGYLRADVFDQHGNVIPHFTKDKINKLDYDKEIEKQKRFFLKHHPKNKKRKRKRKPNGSKAPAT